MRLIVTHEQPDFDALASLALAKLLFPGSIATTQGTLSRQIQAFLRLYRDELDLLPHDAIDLNAVSELVVVDTADPTRIKPFDQLLGKVTVTVYDHHPTPANAIVAARGIVQQVGATTTLLARELHATAVPIPAPVATLALLAIHEDSGNLTFDLTTPDDYRAAAHLLASGANLGVVRRFAHEQLTPEQLTFREALLQHASSGEVAGRPVVTAAFTHPQYVPAVSGLVNDLIDLYAVDAAVVAVAMDGVTLVFARSNERFDCAAALASAIGGGGHAGAAFGKSSEPPDATLASVLEALAQHAAPTVRARDLMSSPVKSLPQSATVSDAVEKLLLFGHNGMPVLDPSGAVVGVVSRRDLDRALRHGMGTSRVTGFMSRGVVSASPEATLSQLETMVLDNNIGRIPIVEDGALIGIVTRTDIIGARHQRPQDDRAGRLLERLPPSAREALERARQLAGDSALYLVGGTVRDLLLGAGVKDIDLVVVGDAARFGTMLQAALGGTLSAHVEFGTATLALPSGLELDVAAAREETYAWPGALPDVVPSSIQKDMARRDFTVNAMALRLNPQPAELLDPYQGEADLNARQLRVLHPLSFVEDPTRVLRGARLAGRLGFGFETDTAERARAVLAPERLGTARPVKVSHSRSRAELELIFDEPRVAPVLTVLTDLGALQAIFGLQASGGPLEALPLTQALDALRQENQLPSESYL
ncbi:MAG: CBS domain-containing protein, partial [Trueperaceae bacterium]